MSEQVEMWVWPDGELPRPFVPPPWFSAGKNTPYSHVSRVSQGLHPFGAQLGPEESRCGTCQHRSTRERGRNYYKCKLARQTCGPGTDLCLKWRGCEYWEVAA